MEEASQLPAAQFGLLPPDLTGHAAASGLNVGSFGGSRREGLFGLCRGSLANSAAARLLLSLLIPTSRVAGYYDELSEGQRSLLPK